MSDSKLLIVSCVQISHIKCRSAGILSHIGRFDILMTFTTNFACEEKKFSSLHHNFRNKIMLYT